MHGYNDWNDIPNLDPYGTRVTSDSISASQIRDLERRVSELEEKVKKLTEKPPIKLKPYR